jgi:hypothetical protein
MLASDRERARAMGLAARRRAEESHSLQANAPRRVRGFREAVGLPAARA